MATSQKSGGASPRRVSIESIQKDIRHTGQLLKPQSQSVHADAHENISNSYRRRHDYAASLVLSYGNFLTRDERVRMYRVLMQSMEWGFGKADVIQTGEPSDTGKEEVIYV